MTRKLLVALAATTGALSIVPSAQALTSTPVWQCRGSATYASVSGQNRVEPIVANGNINTANGGNPDRAQCVDSETGAGNTATQLGISPDFLGAVTGKASTSITPELGMAINQKAHAEGRVEDLSLLVGAGGPTLGVGAANSTADGTCVAGNASPVFSGDSRVADITIGGNPVPLDQLVTQLTNALNPILGAVVEIKADERIATPTSLTIRALHIKVLKGTTPLVDLVVGEAKVAANGEVCNPSAQTGGSGNADVCPPGSELDSTANVCIIRASTSGSGLGDIIVGRPYQGPSGGTVVPIDVARKRFGRTPCLSGNGAPKFAIVGTNKNDRITGTNVADRILGLAGNDQISGGRGNDCIEGGSGRDVLSGSLGNDSLFGQAGNDALGGGGGNDRLSGGNGNDTINAGFGADRTFGGAGNDAINIATQGPRATADCGSGGNDKVRFNAKEKRGIHNCEIRYTIRDR
ncbi:MAG: trimeric autotransporter adhesin [Solirubrobacteraceae bacterium]|jgi:Ca2+-binding RTX toxin-like protein|nr:trimeric autotransporter adhesin [Solirubrobacteraceae bacterium]